MTDEARTESVRWPWLLSDSGIVAVVLTVTGLGIAALVVMSSQVVQPGDGCAFADGGVGSMVVVVVQEC
ncbi:hypothetical protein AB0F81_42990, partial [Actinoplanes sp. NPDC024001]|uniref:hypothetical protein n=1 Tax=Actinoplanes sp. NPDC024001 TaxID=3154598 RepID=UPI0033E9474A